MKGFFYVFFLIIQAGNKISVLLPNNLIKISLFEKKSFFLCLVIKKFVYLQMKLSSQDNSSYGQKTTDWA